MFNVVPGGGREAGEPLGRHPDVAMVSFTGSTATGRLFLKYAAESTSSGWYWSAAARTRRW